MSAKESLRPGGRSARVQKSVHQAVEALALDGERTALTVPAIAARAGVTPSTIYRRWGDLQALLADVAVQRLRPETDPAETGSTRRDLEIWLEQYADEMSSAPGRQMMRDVLAGGGNNPAGKCCNYTRQQLDVIVGRAGQRGEPCPETETLIDRLVAPVMFRILFDDVPPTGVYCHSLVSLLMQEPQAPAIRMAASGSPR